MEQRKLLVVHTPKPFYKKIRMAAAANDLTISAYVRLVLEEAINHQETKKGTQYTKEQPTVINNTQSGISKAEFTHAVDNIIIEALKV